MIFVVKAGVNRNKLEKIELREKLYKELNQEGKHQVVMLPEDCTYDIINDFNREDVKVIIKEIEKG